MIICIIKRQAITSSEYAPWYVVPADDKEMARYIVAKIIWEEMQNIPILRNLRWTIRSRRIWKCIKKC
jgi:hypothetical protein